MPNTSFLSIASKIASRVFSLAQTPAKPPGLPSIPLVKSPGCKRSIAEPSPLTAPTHADSLTPPAFAECVSVAAMMPNLIGLKPIDCSSFRPTSSADLWKSVGCTQPAPTMPFLPISFESHSSVTVSLAIMTRSSAA